MLKMERSAIVAIMLVALGAATGCAPSGSAQLSGGAQPSQSSQTRSQKPSHLVIDTGVEAESRKEFHPDWSFDVNDPQALYEFSSAVIAGKVIEVEQSYVDGNAMIGTIYSVQVEKIYKGQGIPKTISLSLPGGSVPLGEYIASLDKLGLYDMKLGRKSPELLRRAGLDPDQELAQDPRAMNPATPVLENWGTNPTSKTLIEGLQPDSWVFYIGEIEGDVYYGAAFDHAMSYLKDGVVYSLHPEAEGVSTPESGLLNK